MAYAGMPVVKDGLLTLADGHHINIETPDPFVREKGVIP